MLLQKCLCILNIESFTNSMSFCGFRFKLCLHVRGGMTRWEDKKISWREGTRCALFPAGGATVTMTQAGHLLCHTHFFISLFRLQIARKTEFLLPFFYFKRRWLVLSHTADPLREVSPQLCRSVTIIKRNKSHDAQRWQFMLVVYSAVFIL